jgi:hypothetical protein
MSEIKSIRASSFNIANLCSASPKELLGANPELNRDIEDCPGAENLAMGTTAHKFLEKCITESLTAAEMYIITESKFPQMLNELRGFWHYFCSDGPIQNIKNGICEAEKRYKIPGTEYEITGHIDYYLVLDNEINMIDWKYGNGQKYIMHSIDDDLQMMCYAFMLFCEYNKPVNVYRVRVSDREIDFVNYSNFATASIKLHDIAKNCIENPQYKIGYHCNGCLARNTCPARLKAIVNLWDLLIMDVVGKPTLTKEQATRWKIHSRALVGRIKQLDDACADAIKQGVEITDGNMAYKKITYKMEIIQDVEGVQKLCEKYKILPKIKITKSAIEKACQECGENPKSFFNEACRSGFMKIGQGVKYMWKKI